MTQNLPSVDSARLAALALGASPDYRVLMRIKPQTVYGEANGRRVFRGLVVDCEATGTDANMDVMFELALLPFTYTEDGEVLEVLEDEIYVGFQDPGSPLSLDVKAITRRTDEELKGKFFDVAAIEDLARKTDFCVAHHAAFDRRMLERLAPIFKEKAFGCSMSQISWREEQIYSAKQEFIAMSMGLFYDAHQAIEDCRALLHILANPLPETRRWPLAVIRENLAMPLYSILAVDTPFAAKQDLYRLGFRWQAESGTRQKGYRKNVPLLSAESDLEKLIDLLARYRCNTQPVVSEIQVLDRFTDRE